jgi:hypothetical protein
MKCGYLDSAQMPRFTKRASITKGNSGAIKSEQIMRGPLRYTQQLRFCPSPRITLLVLIIATMSASISVLIWIGAAIFHLTYLATSLATTAVGPTASHYQVDRGVSVSGH